MLFIASNARLPLSLQTENHMEVLPQTLDIDNYGLALSDDDPVGEDPRYLDEFDVAHSEINKMSGNDFKLIEQQCRYILLEKSKDLRIAGFLILALTYEKDISGLIEGLSIYNELLNSFGATLHPARPAAKAAAIKWLNNPKIEAFVKNTKINDIETLNRLKQLIQQLNQQITSLFPEIESHFFVLNTWINQQKIEPSPQSSMASQVMAKILPNKNTDKASIPKIIESQQELIAHSKILFNYFKKQKHRPDAIALTRAIHWSEHFKLPRHNQNKPLIKPIRKEALDEIIQLHTNQNNPEALFSCCEGAIWDNSGPYLLDLNYYSYCALNQLEDFDAVETLTLKVKQLINRLPSLIYLSFDDDSPFANSDTQQWLTELTDSARESIETSSAPTNNHEKSYIDFISQTRSNDLLDQIQALKILPVSSKREELEKSFAIAQLLTKKNKDIAITYYHGIIKTLEQYHLDMWLPELGITILKAYLKLLKTVPNQTAEITKITNWLSQLDPCACL